MQVDNARGTTQRAPIVWAVLYDQVARAADRMLTGPPACRRARVTGSGRPKVRKALIADRTVRLVRPRRVERCARLCSSVGWRQRAPEATPRAVCGKRARPLSPGVWAGRGSRVGAEGLKASQPYKATLLACPPEKAKQLSKQAGRGRRWLPHASDSACSEVLANAKHDRRATTVGFERLERHNDGGQGGVHARGVRCTPKESVATVKHQPRAGVGQMASGTIALRIPP